MEKAQAAGRNDARLKDNIERVEKQLAEGKVVTEDELKQAELEQQKERARYEKFEQANAAVRSKNPAQRIGGIRNLCALAGADCVSVAAFLMLNDSEYGVREAAAIALGSLGAAAKPALPNLKAMLSHACNDSLNQTREQMEAALKCEDFKRAVRDAYQKVSK